ncbi:ribonuclease P protein component [Candidatus Gottesmanbacteria bacterium RIFCSPLOWO2_01_FULL_46_9]|uniref:Ribonuclease P protein component n=1 Tax=Candidatus Gottesmanbacteria bacterium RIFCSPLOWO2_01_FULL_46_9 TaxID=1798394 RepID=A0A1F6AZ15_9BACT|nr:MAG: ribonuclease P protein component [Candidatus Gottesmanbacteria bacterium RIFCSPLOWO2_01_FULL_46_9]
MLPRSHRLPSPDIDHVLRFGKRIPGELFQLIIAPNSSVDSGNLRSRFAFIVSTKVDKRATHRNRIRRLLSESVRLRMESIKPGYDCVFIAKKPFGDVGIGEVEKMVVEMLSKAHLLSHEL